MKLNTNLFLQVVHGGKRRRNLLSLATDASTVAAFTALDFKQRVLTTSAMHSLVHSQTGVREFPCAEYWNRPTRVEN